MTDFDRRTVEEFRAGGGQVGGMFTGTPMVLIHHVGARTGIERVTPLAYQGHENGIAIAASNGGSRHHPAWYYNLKAHPAITVELGTERFQATAEEQTGPARAELWSSLAAQFPDLTKHAAGTERTIPLFLLRLAAPHPEDQRLNHPERSLPSALPLHCPVGRGDGLLAHGTPQGSPAVA